MERKFSDSNDNSKNSGHMTLSVFAEYDEIVNICVPYGQEGYVNIENPDYRFINLVAQNNQWFLNCKRPAYVRNIPINDDVGAALKSIQLVEVDCDENAYGIYSEYVSSEEDKFRKYDVKPDQEISIGKSNICDIVYRNPYVSNKHAILMRSLGKWRVRNLDDSYYGVYVNGEKKEYAEVSVGDLIQIMGMKIIIGTHFIAISGGAAPFTINDRIKLETASNSYGYGRYGDAESSSSETEVFNRLPRKKTDLNTEAITIDGPPMSMNQQQIPLLLRMGSSLVMGGAAALAGNFMTLISSTLFPILNSKFTDKQKNEYEELRRRKYTEYLEAKRKEIVTVSAQEKQWLNQKYPTIESVVDIAVQKTHLWPRRPIDKDFLYVRLGTGTLPLSVPIEYPPKRFELEIDDLERAMYRLAEESHVVSGVPITLSLFDTRVSALVGSKNILLEYLKQIILQIATLHSYDEVKMLFLLGKEDLAHMEYLKYIPHAWDDSRSVRFVSTTTSEAFVLGEYLKDKIEDDLESNEVQKILRKRPHFVVVALNKKLFETHEIMKDILQAEHNIGVSVITAYEDMPKETQKIISLNNDSKGVCTSLDADGGDDISFVLDIAGKEKMSKAFDTIANISLRTAKQAQEMPKAVAFLETLGVGRIEQLNPMKRWKESNPSKSLAAPVGIGTDGSLFILDLHEKHQGPHGLVAGMTGSGKSEFLITYILSMAVNYHPDEVAFVLIDYKGGGLAGAFENPQKGIRLPHLAGTITNLDGASVQRSLMSIESELIRRQRIFNEIKGVVNEGTMDIYEYQKLYRAGKVSEPIPHLFIISDEFAELKQQQPEFMAKLISAARIGRSLGVHLILATQKPSGVVDDQIRSNTKFRVCLRVQEKSDSMDMLKRPEAAELKDTGRFYLQVGYNEQFAMGQSAWCGADYEPQDNVVVKKDETVEFLDISGQVLLKAVPKVRKEKTGTKQLVAVVKYLSEIAEANGIRPHSLWTPELQQRIDLQKLQGTNSNELGNMCVALGMVDDPENQTQFPYTTDFLSVENMLIAGNGGSGKTTLVQSILLSLSEKLGPQDLNYYILDYSSRMMKVFKQLPHCGAVLCEEDAEALDDFFKIINAIVAERKQLFSELEVDSFEAARKKRRIPLILVVIDSISGLSSTKKGEQHNYALPGYLKNCANYGVKYIISCSHTNDASSRIRQELPERVIFQMKDKYDFSELLGCKVSYIPPELPGRGLVNIGGRPLEIQLAMFGAESDESERNAAIKAIIGKMAQKYGNQFEAQHLPVFSETASYEDFAKQFKPGRIPLGYAKPSNKPIALPLKQFSALSLYFGNPKGKKPVLENILYAAKRENMELLIVKQNNSSLFDKSDDGCNPVLFENAEMIDSSIDNVKILQRALVAVMTQRKEVLEKRAEELGLSIEDEKLFSTVFDDLLQEAPPIMLLIENLAEFISSLDIFLAMSFKTLFEKAFRRNIYILTCLYPDASEDCTNSLVFSFFKEQHLLLFGGHYDQQKICAALSDSSDSKQVPYNAAAMQYRNSLYPVTMPCGVEITSDEDTDLTNVFELN